MAELVLTVAADDWYTVAPQPGWVEAVEAGRVLFFPHLKFALEPAEIALLGPSLLAEGSRNISLDAQGHLKGAAADSTTQAAVTRLVARYAAQARGLVQRLFPAYDAH